MMGSIKYAIKYWKGKGKERCILNGKRVYAIKYGKEKGQHLF